MRDKIGQQGGGRIPIFRTLAFLAVALLAIAVPAMPLLAAPGDLLISPVRVVLEGRQRSAELTLVNRGEEAMTYRVEFENRRMLEDGRFEAVAEAREGELFADSMIRYAPRRITLEPGSPQTIRVLLRKPSDLAEGEYRSHLLFRAVPEASDSNSIESLTDEGGQELSIRLIPVYGVTIPVIVRQGDLNAQVKIADAKVMPAEGQKEPRLSILLERQGARSVYGNVAVRFAGSPEDEGLIGLIRGLAVYTPNKSRRVELPLDAALAGKLAGREVEIAFSDVGPSGEKVLARERILIR